MKGFTKDDKFHPIRDVKGVRKSRDSNAKTVGVNRDQSAKTQGVKIRKSRGDIKPKLPKPYTPAWNKLKDNVVNRIAHDFNNIRLENLNKINEYWSEDIITADPTMDDVKDYFGDSSLSDKEFAEKHDDSEIDDAKQDLMDQQREVMWGTVFEATDSHLAEKIIENSDAIINDAGFTVIDMRQSDKDGAYDTAVFLAVNGAGYDFYEQHWIPFYRILGWV